MSLMHTTNITTAAAACYDFCVLCIQLAESCPHQCLEWLSAQVVRNKTAASWTLQHLDFWVETYLISYSNVRVRNGMPAVEFSTSICVPVVQLKSKSHQFT